MLDEYVTFEQQLSDVQLILFITISALHTGAANAILYTLHLPQSFRSITSIAQRSDVADFP
jgi:hypothetical protein